MTEFKVLDKRGQNKEEPEVEAPPEPQKVERDVCIQAMKTWPIHNLGLAVSKRGEPVGVVDFSTGKAILSGEYQTLYVTKERYNEFIMEKTEEQRQLDKSKSRNAQRKNAEA